MSQRILVVDDDAENREMLITVLQASGYTVLSAEDGQAGFDQACKDRPDLIVTDLYMPICNGVEMIRRLRSHPEIEEMPIMVLTARSSGISLTEALKAGANGGTYKPVELNVLMGLISQMLAGDASNNGYYILVI